MPSAREKRMANDLSRLDPMEGEAQNLRPESIEELRREIVRTKDPKARNVLVAELARMGQVGTQIGMDAGAFAGPQVGGDGSFRPPTGEADAGAFVPPSTAPAPTPTPTEAPETPGVAAPGEVAVNPSGAVTGRTQVPAPRDPSREQSPSPVGRMVMETAGAFLGGTAGAVAGPGGMRAGETAGAMLGSFAAEAVDPTKRPGETALVTGAATALTGTAASAATFAARKLAGKPHEAGRALADIMQRTGKVPPPGAVLESDFIRNAESIGSAAFGTSELLKAARQEAADVTADATRNYISGFQRFHESATLAFKEVDAALGAAGLKIKGSEAVRDALSDVVREGVRVRGSADALDSHLKKLHNWIEGGTKPTFTFDEVQKLYGSLYDKARALDLKAARGDAGDVRDAEFIRELASEVKGSFDAHVDALVKSGRVPPETKEKLILARASWAHWLEGKEVELMVLKATKDAVGEGPISGKRLSSEIDKVMKREKEVGSHILSPATKESLRKYALALSAVEASSKVGAYGFIGRVGQLAGITGMGFGWSGTGATLFLAPHALAYVFSNAQASALMIRGLRLDPGSAAAARLAREFTTLLAKENLIQPDRIEESGPVRTAMEEDARRKFVPQ